MFLHSLNRIYFESFQGIFLIVYQCYIEKMVSVVLVLIGIKMHIFQIIVISRSEKLYTVLSKQIFSTRHFYSRLRVG